MVVPTTVPLHAIATAVAMVIVFKVSARVKVLTKRGAKAVSDCVGTPFPAESAPQILGRAKNRKPKSLHSFLAPLNLLFPPQPHTSLTLVAAGHDTKAKGSRGKSLIGERQ
eukprot:scaffold5896_cov119-Skeletonema_marinoi.AAC.1